MLFYSLLQGTPQAPLQFIFFLDRQKENRIKKKELENVLSSEAVTQILQITQ